MHCAGDAGCNGAVVHPELFSRINLRIIRGISTTYWGGNYGFELPQIGAAGARIPLNCFVRGDTHAVCDGGACACPFLNSDVPTNNNQCNGTKFDDYGGLLFADMINGC